MGSHKMGKIGKSATACARAPGFVANRIQMAMAAEAFAIVQEGLATPSQVDRIVRSSFGFRLSAFGPFEICDQAGIDTYQAIYQYLYEKLRRPQFMPPPILEEYIKQGRRGLKSGVGFYEYSDGGNEVKKRRDERLYSRLRLFKSENQNTNCE